MHTGVEKDLKRRDHLQELDIDEIVIQQCVIPVKATFLENTRLSKTKPCGKIEFR
jgi:hypothetical protein